jgi:uncharacterized protein with von Willebrand factor type A (vWA) domain
VLSFAPPLDPGTALRARLAGFPGFLHANGFGVGVADAARVLLASAIAGILDREVLRWSLRALLSGRVDEWRRFDTLFDAYFLPPNRSAFEKARAAREAVARTSGPAGDVEAPVPAAVAGDGTSADESRAERHGASREESLAHTNFRDLHDADDVRAIEALMRRFARRMKRLRLRREARTMRGRSLDLQATIRASVASGGTPIRLAWKDRRRVRPRLVLLLDVSRSMSRYSFFHLRLARALCAELTDVRCFIFHTRITGVDEALRDPDPWRSQERLHLLAAGWGGGTRIGDCLEDFNRRLAPRLVHARTAVIVASDGYDTGEPGRLATAMAGLARRARRVAWMNPLLDEPGFSPESHGMKAALPYVDRLVSGANLAAIERALPELLEVLR